MPMTDRERAAAVELLCEAMMAGVESSDVVVADEDDRVAIMIAASTTIALTAGAYVSGNAGRAVDIVINAAVSLGPDVYAAFEASR